MSTATAVDERVNKASPLTRIMRRPEIGALMGALVVYIFFSVADQTGTFFSLDGTARWTDVASTYGIIAVAVALLMIGGEFDLSSGVMIGSSGLFAGLLMTEYSIGVWPSIFLTFLFAAAIGFTNGWLVVTTGLPSFIVTLAMFFSLRGINLGVTKLLTDTVRVAGIAELPDGSPRPGYESAKAVFAFRLLGLQFPHRRGLVARPYRRCHLGPNAHTIWQLDLRRWRGFERCAQRRRAGASHQDHAVHVRLNVVLPGGHHQLDASEIYAGRSGCDAGIHFHHRGRRWRLFADRRIRIRDRRDHRCRHHRNGLHRHRLRPMEHRLDLAVPRLDPLRRRPYQFFDSPPIPRSSKMTETSSHEPAALALENVGKRFGSVIALSDVSMSVPKNRVTCVLGDNGAGKSTLIKILSGVHTPSDGQMYVNGEPTTFSSPREALDMGIATVFQDLATVPLMAVWRNFYLGNEPTRGFWPFKGLRAKYAKESCKAELANMGIDIRDTEQPVGTLSGGERQAVSIARAVHFGANVLILDEPTSALGVKQSGVVLKHIRNAADAGISVVFITHNPHHAYLVGDNFYLLNRGQMMAEYSKDNVSREELVKAMAGGAELDALAHELGAKG